MKKIAIVLLVFFISYANAQMVESDGRIKYGNEWIDYNNSYYKISIKKDGIYRIKYQHLIAAGINVNNIDGRDYRLYVYGKEIPIYTSTENTFGSSDYIEFYGEKNRSQLDYYLFRQKEDLLNPEYSMFTDEAVYFLTWDNSSSGKRYIELANDLSGNLPNVEEFYYHTEKKVFYSDYNKPIRDEQNHVYNSNFDTGEGFGSKLQQINSSLLKTYNYIHSSERPIVKLRFTTNSGSHSLKIKLNNNIIKHRFENGYVNKVIEIPISSSDIKSDMNISLEGNNAEDKNSISVVSLKYSRAFDFLNKDFFRFNIEKSHFYQYYEIKNFVISGTNSIVLYDIKNATRIVTEIDYNNNLVKFILPPSDNQRQLVLVNSGQAAKNISQLKKVEFLDVLNQQYSNYIIISDIDRFSDGQTNWVEEYSNYRSSFEGGNFNVLSIDIDDIYNQFGYGIERHSQSLNNFIIYLKDNFTNPEYVFIIGKGIEYKNIRTPQQLYNHRNLFFVPTFGYPGSDNLLAARYNLDIPEIAIGRIAVKNYSQIRLYLNKVKEQENYSKYSQTVADKEWMKKVIHLAGGGPDNVQNIRASLNSMGDIIKNNRFGGYVHTYDRNSGTEDESVIEKINKDINGGSAIVTFFGHSGVTGTDFNISNLSNVKFPVFYSLGCYSGNIHTNTNNGQSEKFVLDNNGVIVYAGTSGAGYTNALSMLGKRIYTNTGDFYGFGLGKIIKKSLENLSSGQFTSLLQQFTFHGDPAIVLYKHDGPDIIIDNTKTQIFPITIHSNTEKFSLNFDVVNLGEKIEGQLEIMILRTTPTGIIDTVYTTIEELGTRESISVEFPTHYIDGVGENCIDFVIDPFNNFLEQPSPEAENNNIDIKNRYCFQIINTGAKPIYPEDFSIVNKTRVNLQASTYSYFIENQQFIIQIDTTELFDSPILTETIINSNGGLINWEPSINFQENSVYYWRISPYNSEPIWENSSFIYLPNSSEGWNQSHYYQYLKDEFEDMEFYNRSLDFGNDIREVDIITKKYDSSDSYLTHVNGTPWGSLYPKHLRPALMIYAWGPQKIFFNKTGTDFGSVLHKPHSYIFKTNTLDQRKGIKDLLDSIPDSSTVYIYTILDDEINGLSPETWAQDSVQLGYNLFNVLESYGASKIRLMETTGTVPYIFVFKKGGEVLAEKIGETIDDELNVIQAVTINKKQGSLFSTIIGPSLNWDKIIWDEIKEPSDKSYVKIYKLNSDLEQTIVFDSLNSVYERNLNEINAAEYPYLKLEYYASDDKQHLSPPKFNFWRVLYEGYPDAILVNSNESYFHSDTLEYGDVFRFKTTVYNNTNSDMSSLLVQFKIKNKNNEEIISTKRYEALLANSSYEIDFEYPVNDLIGNNEFYVEINYDKEQKEKNYFNNSGIKRFYVKANTLPLDFLSIRAFKENNNSKIVWTTTNETNCDYFVVEKSNDGFNFEILESFDAKGIIGSINNYHCYDKDKNLGVVYYRVCQISYDGIANYSKIVKVVFTENDFISVYPNPFKNQFTIDVNFLDTDNQIDLVNLNGETLQTINADIGIQEILVKAPELLNGIYFIRVNNGKCIKTHKIIKLAK